MGPREVVYDQYRAACTSLACSEAWATFRLAVLYEFHVQPDTLLDEKRVDALEEGHTWGSVHRRAPRIADLLREHGHYSVHGTGSAADAKHGHVYHSSATK